MNKCIVVVMYLYFVLHIYSQHRSTMYIATYIIHRSARSRSLLLLCFFSVSGMQPGNIGVECVYGCVAAGWLCCDDQTIMSYYIRVGPIALLVYMKLEYDCSADPNT